MTVYVAGWHKPDDLDDSECALYDTFEGARDRIVDELESYAERADDDDADDALEAADEAAEAPRPFEITGGDYVWWVTKATD